MKDTKKRLGVISVIIQNRKEYAPKVNKILTDYGDIIIGRIGVPYKDRGINVIAVIVDGTTDEIGALTGKLGMIEDVSVKSVLTRI
jgi:putative iron-only hydrogenase system regulator